MSELYGLGSFGIVPHLSDDALKQAKYADIKSQAGRIAYLSAAGRRGGKPTTEEGIKPAKGALKWIAKLLEEEN
ncbi:MAG: hypothetical protein KKC80_03760 [Candidatus Margulisbacteria bacterium]|nr:hypothetical protein [Candidatus Margulisiibacteriota bacterium]MBU1617418.1 hypothetical protein [Candidatus Margulisiibacteriota bacterium]MBU1867764.1 hypothetical protein [Candidatus Margulisiibacteriota bacterium]